MSRRWSYPCVVRPPRPFVRYFFAAILGTGLLLTLMTLVMAASMRASMYDEDKFVATGLRYDPNGMTAAHRTLPFGTRIFVAYGHRKIVVTISDRGPAEWTKRELDLSAGAAKALNFPGTGTVKVSPWPPLPRERPR